MNTKHTPTPWHVGMRAAERIVYDGTGWAVANATIYHAEHEGGQTLANAAFIVRACNAHDDLLAALETIANQCGPFTVHGLPPLDYATIGNIARAAIAEATAQGFAPDGRK